jgi:hypothetical protein
MLENKFFINEEGNQMQLDIQDMQLPCFLPAGAVIEKEVNCNSTFMLKIYQKLHLRNTPKTPLDTSRVPLFLVKDYAEGHETRKAKEEYTRRLGDDININIIQQSACSPEVNALDLASG